MTHNEQTIANEIASLSAKALMHRMHLNRAFTWDGLTFMGSERSARILEKAAENLTRETFPCARVGGEMTTTSNQIDNTTIVRTWGLKPSSGGFGEWDVYSDPSEWAEMGDHFGDMERLHSSEFDAHGIENISGRIRNEAGKGELYAWLDRGEWMYCLVEEQGEEDAN
jgi:hypothetical protein